MLFYLLQLCPVYKVKRDSYGAVVPRERKHLQYIAHFQEGRDMKKAATSEAGIKQNWLAGHRYRWGAEVPVVSGLWGPKEPKDLFSTYVYIQIAYFKEPANEYPLRSRSLELKK